MAEFLLCVVGLLFVGWVVVLSSEKADMRSENAKLRAELKRSGRGQPSSTFTLTDKDVRPPPKGKKLRPGKPG